MQKIHSSLYALLAASALVLAAASSCSKPAAKEITISKEVLQDKIKGGWAGQVIGCTYGGPTEFKYSGSMIQDYIPIDWKDGAVKWYYDNSPGLYDDVYMDLTFVDVFDRLGLDAPVDSFATAFAYAGYPLWHANQAARYNIRHGILPPDSGHWRYNAHADDIDFQIEADFAGLMSPGMPNSASAFCDKIGHIMNYGDGWYGGVYVAAMYALAFVYDDVEKVVTDALATIPAQSNFHHCMSDVIAWHRQYPDNWKQAWFEVQCKYSEDRCCPGGVFNNFDIDAVINSAYIVIGLLYGEGDFDKTLEISTRCGQDSDCNPASAGGILATMLGYSNIPEKWMANLHEVEDMDFAYTTISLNDVYRMGYEQALQVIARDGGEVLENEVKIALQEPEAVAFEECLPGLMPYKRESVIHDGVETPLAEFSGYEFDGKGIVILGGTRCEWGYEAEIDVYVDGALMQTVLMPKSADRHNYRDEIFFNYELEDGHHTVTLDWKNPVPGAEVNIKGTILYR